MKKILRTMIFAILILMISSFAAAAAETGSELPDFGMEEAERALPDGASELYGLRDGGSLLSKFSWESVLDFLSGSTYTIIKEALRDFARIFAVVLIFVLLGGVMQAAEKSYASTAFDFTAMLVAALTFYSCMGRALQEATGAVQDLSIYIKALMPVFAGTLTMSGAPVSGTVLPAAALAGINLLSDLNLRFFLPMIQLYFSLCLAGGISKKITACGFAKIVKSTVTWCLTAICTIFVSLLSIQRLITGASDGVAAKTAQFALSSIVPVVGGIVKDALATVAGSINMIKSVAGAIGVGAIFFVLVPIFIRLFIYSILFRLAAAFSSFSGTSRLSDFLSAAAEVWNIIFAVTACEGILFVLGIAILMTVGGG